MKAIFLWSFLAVPAAYAGENKCTAQSSVDELLSWFGFLGEELDEEPLEVPDSGEAIEVEVEVDVGKELPSGSIEAQTLLDIFESWKNESPTFLEIVQRLLDGEERVISGDAVRQAIELAGLSLPEFIPSELLESVEIRDGQLVVHLKEDLELAQPSIKTWVVDPEGLDDPLSVDNGGLLRQEKSPSYTLKINEELVFNLDEEGLASIREGDLVASKFVFTRSIQLGSVHDAPGIQRIKDSIVVQVDDNGDPIVVDGHYLPVEADEWLEIEVAGDVTRLPIARLSN